jgi:hypothetical protein
MRLQDAGKKEEVDEVVSRELAVINMWGQSIVYIIVCHILDIKKEHTVYCILTVHDLLLLG